MGRASRGGRTLTNAAVTSPQLEGEKIMYENEVRALRSDSVLHRISRDSEFRCVRKPLWLGLRCGYPMHRCET